MNYVSELQRSAARSTPAPCGVSEWPAPQADIVGGENPWANDQSDAHILRLVKLMAGRRKIRQGAALFNAHDRFEVIYAVHSGSFKSTLTMANGCEQVNSFHRVGDLLGLDGVAEGRHASGATALEDSDVSMVSYVHLCKLFANLAGMQHTVNRLISRELVRGNCHMRMLGGLNSVQRVAAFLLEQSRSFGALGYSPTEFHLKMTRSDIGSFLGLTLETVSRMFSELQQQRLLRVDRRHIVISDLDGLGRV